jgi:hypothetical protein
MFEAVEQPLRGGVIVAFAVPQAQAVAPANLDAEGDPGKPAMTLLSSSMDRSMIAVGSSPRERVAAMDGPST